MESRNVAVLKLQFLDNLQLGILDIYYASHWSLCSLFHCFLRLYYAKIGIGTPAKSYYVQVDTGSDIMWVNCIQCKQCPTRSSLGVSLLLCISSTFTFRCSNSMDALFFPCIDWADTLQHRRIKQWKVGLLWWWFLLPDKWWSSLRLQS